jgi:xanthine dehydrogenase accessory factor
MHDYLEHAHHLRAAGHPFVIATVVRAERPTSAKPGATAIVTADGQLTGWVGGSCAAPTVIREALRALQDGQPVLLRMGPPDPANPAVSGRGEAPGVIERAMTCISGGTLDIYLEPHLAQPLLVAISHLPIAEALASLGKGLGYAVTVAGIDATPDSFPQADRVLNGLDFGQIPLRPQTYIVVASHGNYDEEALTWALSTGASYVALVASPKRARAVVETLRETGIPDERLARLKFPAGLDIGAVTPEEIASASWPRPCSCGGSRIGTRRTTSKARITITASTTTILSNTTTRRRRNRRQPDTITPQPKPRPPRPKPSIRCVA